MPGDVFNHGFIEAWNNGNQALDANDLRRAAEVSGIKALLLKAMVPGVKPVDNDGGQLAQAIVSHDTVDL